MGNARGTQVAIHCLTRLEVIRRSYKNVTSEDITVWDVTVWSYLYMLKGALATKTIVSMRSKWQRWPVDGQSLIPSYIVLASLTQKQGSDKQSPVATGSILAAQHVSSTCPEAKCVY
jgi:hypothetical protein